VPKSHQPSKDKSGGAFQPVAVASDSGIRDFSDRLRPAISHLDCDGLEGARAVWTRAPSRFNRVVIEARLLPLAGGYWPAGGRGSLGALGSRRGKPLRSISRQSLRYAERRDNAAEATPARMACQRVGNCLISAACDSEPGSAARGTAVWRRRRALGAGLQHCADAAQRLDARRQRVAVVLERPRPLSVMISFYR
jgi:hypothetical protein